MTAAVADPAAVYREEIGRAGAEVAAEDARVGRIGLLRLADFVLAAVLAVTTVLTKSAIAGVGVGLLIVVFIVLVILHERAHRRLDRARRSLEYYERGLARLEDRWAASGDDGARFRDDQHLYATDLELFGPGSLFHLITVTSTETGAATLADWLKAAAPPAEILARQLAVRELAPLLPLRHDLAVTGKAVSGALDSAGLRAWLAASPVGVPAWVVPAAAVIAVTNVVTTVAALAAWIPGAVTAASYVAGATLALTYRYRVLRVLREVDQPSRELIRLAGLLDRLANVTFSSSRLQQLARTWESSGRSPAQEIRRLIRLTDLVDARRNQLFAPLSALCMAGTELALGIERWRLRVGPAAAGWLAAVGELEALASLATQAYEHPDDTDPEMAEPGAELQAIGLAHPLLPTSRAIRNDMTLGGTVRLAVVSGSNMSGKSTLLKALGANLVLGFAGGPVRATRLVTPPLAIGASLVLRDSLLEGRSRFYAEVLRLKDVLKLAGSGQPVLFLLDELLSGTNSHDRAIGARGVLEALVDRGAIGIVTTHDLALTEIAAQLGSRGVNWHFEDRLEDGKLIFDYRLRPGVVRRSNALELMRAVGIRV